MKTHHLTSHGERERGNLLIFALLIVTLLSALLTAYVQTLQKNGQASRFVKELGELRHYADNGANLAVQDLTFGATDKDGMIGADNWSAADDLGKDGIPLTYDEGENDGIPTPGEKNLVPVAIGPPSLGANLIVWTTDSAWPGVKRIVSTAYNSSTIATVEVYAQTSVPGNFGAVYTASMPNVSGWSGTVYVDGRDYNPATGALTGNPSVSGITLPTGTPPGTNKSTLGTKLGGFAASVTGSGGTPSIQEVPALDFDALYAKFSAKATVVKPGGSFSNPVWGTWATNKLQVTHITGSANISGSGKGAGVLLVDGDISMSNVSYFAGLMLVKGNVTLNGGGSGPSGGLHMYGSLLMGKTSSLTWKFTGNSNLRFSSDALKKALALGGGDGYKVVYRNYLK